MKKDTRSLGSGSYGAFQNQTYLSTFLGILLSIRSILGSILGDYYMKLNSNGILAVLLPTSRNYRDSCVCSSGGEVGNIQAIAR